MFGEGELEAIPRRKTVGFRELSNHKKLTISERGNCDESANPDTTVVVIDDGESKQSHSQIMLDKASDSEMHHSMVKDGSSKDL